MKRKEISDQIYGGILGGLYVLPVFGVFYDSFKASKTPDSLLDTVIFISATWIVMSLFDLYLNLTYFFSRGLLEKREAFDPFKMVACNKKHLLCICIIPYLEGLLASVFLWALIGDSLFKVLGFSWKQFSIKSGLVFAVFLLIAVRLFSKLNKKILASKFPAFNEIDLEKEDTEEDEENEKIKRDILGKHVSNLFMVFFISTVFFSGIVVLGDELISFFSYWLILYAFLCLYNAFYLKKKLKKVPLLYCFLGALPFGFILPAFLPQKQ